MANDRGALTDHFGILAIAQGGDTLGDFIKLVESTKVPIPNERADAKDEYGDIVASSYYGNSGGTLYDASSTFAIYRGTVQLDMLKLGELSTGVVVESIEVTTSNGDWPMIKVSGKLGMDAVQVPDGKLATATLPADIDILGAKMAQTMLFSVGAGCRLTASALKATGKISQVDDGLGEPAAYAVEFETAEITADFVRVTAAPSWTVSSPAVEKQAVGSTEPRAEYHTGSGSAEVALTRDTV